MRALNRRKTIHTDKKKTILELQTLSPAAASSVLKQSMQDYIETMAAELAEIATKSGDMFLAYLLEMVAVEARQLQARERWRAA